jgi:hypothetical protein
VAEHLCLFLAGYARWSLCVLALQQVRGFSTYGGQPSRMGCGRGVARLTAVIGTAAFAAKAVDASY